MCITGSVNVEERMPTSQTGFGDFILGRNASMPPGYQMSVLGCPSGVQPPHFAAIAGVPLTYPGFQGYNFIPYPYSRHMGQMNNSYDVKAASPYHPGLLGRCASFYSPYRTVATDDPSRVAKVATRESTSALKAWLNEHLKNPYPTKGEKIMLAIVTKMSLTQVSTWFANARRRLKKENRVSWASKGKSDEEEEYSEEECSTQKGHGSDDEDEIDPQTVDEEVEIGVTGSNGGPQPVELSQGIGDMQTETPTANSSCETDGEKEVDSGSAKVECKGNTDTQKPKIWSLAETATSDSGKKPQGWGHGQQNDNKWWVHWASRNGHFFPISQSTHDMLKQSVSRDLKC